MPDSHGTRSTDVTTARSPPHRQTKRACGHHRVASSHAAATTSYRKLTYLNAAAQLGDLRVPPGNRLELLEGNRAGQHSIRINKQYRICFIWTDNGPTNVEINKHYE